MKKTCYEKIEQYPDRSGKKAQVTLGYRSEPGPGKVQKCLSLKLMEVGLSSPSREIRNEGETEEGRTLA